MNYFKLPIFRSRTCTVNGKMAGKPRYVWRIVFQNFIDSLKPRQIQGNNIGKDYIGNTYFEIPANSKTGKSKPSRWYDPPEQKDFEDALPAEWEAWLRYRRTEPPTEEEIARNFALMKMKRENAAKIEEKRLADGGSLPTRPEKGFQSFPSYSDYKEKH